MRQQGSLLPSAFMLGLILSGITAFPLAWEVRLLNTRQGVSPALAPEHYDGVAFGGAKLDRGLQETYAAYPWTAYGTDWLAFAHIAIAVYFVGSLVNPTKNEWGIYAGLVGCVLAETQPEPELTVDALLRRWCVRRYLHP